MPLPDPFEPVLGTEPMREADRRTMEDYGVPGRVLMETAGRGAADAVADLLGGAEGRRVLVLCGTGNNGGDGLVVARVLHARGADVLAAVLADEDDLTEDAAANLRLLRRIAEADDRRLDVEVREATGDLNPWWPEVVVDALLGIGVAGALREPVGAFARWINACPAPVVALDVPTGLDSQTGEAAEDAVRAELTVTMAAKKAGLLFNDGPAHAGRVEVVPIGIPPAVMAEAADAEGSAWLSTDAAVRALLPERAADAHKYTAGKVVTVCGSERFPGAAVLSAEAAARAGAGAVVCCTPEAARPLVEGRLAEPMTAAMPSTDGGGLAEAALEGILEQADGADAVLVGCGIGREDATQRLVRRLLPRLDAPLVLDADGLNAVAGHTDLLRKHAAGRWVLTPHLGELRRLTGKDDLDATDRIGLARAWAARWNCVLVVKGMPSVVGAPGGRVFVGGAGNAALATAGTGDVLAGVTAGLLAQGLDPADAAICALHLGGRAAERWTGRRSLRSMLAGDLLGELPHVL